jgi:hypothetical protein
VKYAERGIWCGVDELRRRYVVVRAGFECDLRNRMKNNSALRVVRRQLERELRGVSRNLNIEREHRAVTIEARLRCRTLAGRCGENADDSCKPDRRPAGRDLWKARKNREGRAPRRDGVRSKHASVATTTGDKHRRGNEHEPEQAMVERAATGDLQVERASRIIDRPIRRRMPASRGATQRAPIPYRSNRPLAMAYASLLSAVIVLPPRRTSRIVIV